MLVSGMNFLFESGKKQQNIKGKSWSSSSHLLKNIEKNNALNNVYYFNMKEWYLSVVFTSTVMLHLLSYDAELKNRFEQFNLHGGMSTFAYKAS